MFGPFGPERVKRRRRDSFVASAHERIRNHGVKNRVDTVGIDVISNHCQFRLSFRSSSVEYWFEKGTGMCGASRLSACELDTTVPKVNSGANKQPPGQPLAVAVSTCEAKRFVMYFHNLSSSSPAGLRAVIAVHAPADHAQVWFSRNRCPAPCRDSDSTLWLNSYGSSWTLQQPFPLADKPQKG